MVQYFIDDFFYRELDWVMKIFLIENIRISCPDSPISRVHKHIRNVRNVPPHVPHRGLCSSSRCTQITIFQ